MPGVGQLYARTLATTARRAGFLLGLGVLVFVPLGALQALADRVHGIHVSHLGDLSDLATVGLLLGLLAQAMTALFGEVFYSGAVALTLAESSGGHRPSLAGIARRLSYGRLIAVDLAYALLVAGGLVLLIVPGVVAFTWFALAGPVVELENTGFRAALARSRELVRGRFWTVLAVLGPVTLASELITDALLSAGHGAIHNPFLRDWIGEALANVVISPLYAVAAVLLALELREAARAQGAQPREGPAAALELRGARR